MDISIKALVGGSTVFFYESTHLTFIPNNTSYINARHGKEALLVDIYHKNTPDETALLNRLKKGELPVVFVGQPIRPDEVRALEPAISNKKILKCVEYSAKPFFVYFVGESLTDSEVQSLKNTYDAMIAAQKQAKKTYTPPPAKKRFTKSQRKKMKK
jgi:hypothetical protein